MNMKHDERSGHERRRVKKACYGHIRKEKAISFSSWLFLFTQFQMKKEAAAYTACID